MRKLLSTLTVVLAGLLISVPPAGATAARPALPAGDTIFQSCLLPGPSGWTRVGYQFHSCADCRKAGEAGVRRGDWPEYRCGYVPVGLDIVFYLYIPPTQ